MARSKAPKASGRVKRASKSAGKRPSKRAHPSARWTGASLRVLDIVSGGVVGAVVLGVFERFIWLGAVARELGPLLAALSLICAIAAAVLHRWWWLSGLALACVIALMPAWQLLRPVKLSPQRGPLLRVAEATLDGADVKSERARRLRESAPDLLAVVGATDAALRELDFALPTLPYRARGLGADGKQALWSRLPLHGVSREPVVRIRVGQCDVQVAVISVASSLRYERQAARAKSLRALEPVADSARAIWLGALGSRPQAADLTTLIVKHRLRDTRLGNGMLASNPNWLGPLGVSSDHVLVRGWIAVRERGERQALAEGGHDTQVATLELTEPRCRPASI